MSRKSIIWTIIFFLSCSLGVVFSVLGMREHILHPFSAVYGWYFVLILIMLGLGVFSRRRKIRWKVWNKKHN